MTFPLAKYSYGISTSSSSSHFQHINDSNLCVSIGTFGLPQDGKLKMRIVLRASTLETVPLQELAEASQRITQTSRLPVKKEALPLWGNAKMQNLTLALQFDGGEPQAKRIQIRFQQKPHFEDVMDLLQQQLGIRIDFRDRPSTMPGSASDHSDAISNRFNISPLQPGSAQNPDMTAAFPVHSMGGRPATRRPGSTHSEERPASAASFLFQTSSRDSPSSSSNYRPTSPLSRFAYNADEMRPSEIASTHVPPERSLPSGFPPRPDSGRNQPSSYVTVPEPASQRPASGPRTRGKSKLKAIGRNAAQSPQSPATSVEDQPSNERIRLNTITRLPRPASHKSYSFTGAIDPAPAVPPTSSLMMTANTPGPSSQENPIADVLHHHGAFLDGNDLGDAHGLAAYATRGEDRRLAALNKFICDNLRNPDFMTLCEDVEACWRRIGLGM